MKPLRFASGATAVPVKARCYCFPGKSNTTRLEIWLLLLVQIIPVLYNIDYLGAIGDVLPYHELFLIALIAQLISITLPHAPQPKPRQVEAALRATLAHPLARHPAPMDFTPVRALNLPLHLSFPLGINLRNQRVLARPLMLVARMGFMTWATFQGT